jgi:hypothetical protein
MHWILGSILCVIEMLLLIRIEYPRRRANVYYL